MCLMDKLTRTINRRWDWTEDDSWLLGCICMFNTKEPEVKLLDKGMVLYSACELARLDRNGVDWRISSALDDACEVLFG